MSRPIFFPQISILTYHYCFGQVAGTKTSYFKPLFPFTSAVGTGIQIELNQLDKLDINKLPGQVGIQPRL